MVLTVAVTEMALVYKLKHLNKTDSYLIQLQHQLCDDPDSMPHFTFQEGLLLFRKRLIIPPDPALKRLLLEEFHSSNIGGHAGIAWSFLRLSSNFFWLGMRKDVKQFVLQCQVFQQMKDTHSKPAGLLLPIPIPVSIFEDISMDFITGLPPSQGRTVILHRDPIFLSDFRAEINRLQGTKLAKSSAYHPQLDGQTEALNKCLEMYLRCFVADIPATWFHLLPLAEFWYNTSYQHSSKLTPFEVVYGRPPPTVTRYIRDDTSNPDVIESLCRRDETLSLLKSNLQAAEERMKSNADKGRKDVSFEIGDWVYVRLRPYRQLSILLQHHTKLSRRFFGLFKVLHRVGEGLPPSEATWEDLPTLTHQFPDLNLEDKVRLHRGGNVTNPQDHSSTLRRSSRDKQSPKYLVEYVVPKDNRGPLPLSNTAAHIAPACQETSK
ncbi:hypothetical protein P3L10_011788 [Capsicum annuum]